MDGSHTITPFWNRIPRFFLYGLHPNILILIVSLALASYLFGGPLINLVFYIVGIKYASEALQHTMEGKLTPPELTIEVINDNFELPFKLFVVILCYFYALGHIFGLPILMAIPLYIIGLLLIPAVIISFVVTEEIGYALNPINWFNIPLRIGWPYLIMVLFLLLLDTIKYTFTDIMVTRVPRNLIGPLWLAINTYFMAVIFHLMGYVVMQYHEELGADSPQPQGSEDDDEGTAAHTNPRLERFIAEGNIAAAIAELSSLIGENPQDLELRRKMYVYLKSNGEDEHLKRYTPHYFGMLATQHRFSDAATLYLESHERGAPFFPESAASYLPVMQELRRRRNNKQAVILSQGFHKRFPDNPHTPEIYLEMAKVLSEELQRDDLAKQALNFILKFFPGHAFEPQINEYLGILSRMQNPTTSN